MVQRVSGNLDLLTDNIYSRMDKLENSLENKLVHKMAGVIAKRMNTEMKNLRKECDDKIQDLKRDFYQDIADIEAKINSISDVTQNNVHSVDSYDNKRDCNFVIKGLPFHDGENLNSKVNTLISEGLGIKSITVLNTIRKSSDVGDGIVIATLQATEERKIILKAKRKLKDAKNYGKVFIYKDQTNEERSMSRNLKTIVNVIQENGCYISLHGDWVVESSQRSSRGGDLIRDTVVPIEMVISIVQCLITRKMTIRVVHIIKSYK
ncbi:hypothetical protein DPMN_066405 [Dreissena polymorpha]|uniref:Uncharacterized protein n=1 Tax=Dreissena polymorpha TaxID=45954 RepID=A0A9D4BSV9_DREPO|nr:hypothetical protein DPMN_066405 [Dreissena polymorpha]